MDDELRAYLDTMRREFNDAQARVLNKLTTLEADFSNTKDVLLRDSLPAGRRWFDLDDRVGRVERDRRNP